MSERERDSEACGERNSPDRTFPGYHLPMNKGKERLSDLIALGEGFTAEFKSSMPSDLGREICAFANAKGGNILIGVTDKGEICGVDDHNNLRSRIQSIARNADPSIDVEIESVKKVLIVHIPAQQNNRPYSFRGNFVIRQGASSQQMKQDEIRELFHNEGLIHFDEKPCGKFSLNTDLDGENWSLFQKRAGIPADMDSHTALRNLFLIDKDGKMTYAGAWLLAKNIKKFSISADVSCGLFQGTDKTNILDRKDFHKDIYSTIEDVMSWILSKINVAYIIGRVRRKERPELPEEAIREAVVNALAHRDYRSTANVQVYVFKDRLEIVSPGGLPAGMTEADFGVKSVPRNPLLFEMLYRMNAVEKIGSGIRRIRELCREYEVDEPIIEVSENSVITTFQRPSAQVGDEPESRPESQLKSIEQKVLLLIDQSPMAISEISVNLGHKSVSGGLRKVIRSLRSDGLIEYTIPEKPNSRLQKYRITRKGKISLRGVRDTILNSI